VLAWLEPLGPGLRRGDEFILHRAGSIIQWIRSIPAETPEKLLAGDERRDVLN